MREADPRDTKRAESWMLYKDAPMPMVTIMKTLDITGLLALKERGFRLNMLLCYCIGRAAEQVEEFRLLPVGHKLMEYDSLGVSVIVVNDRGGLSSCDLPVMSSLEEFRRVYDELTGQVRRTCTDHELPERMMIGTSALVRYQLDGVVNMYSGIFNNPFLIWGGYRMEGAAAKLPVSFQFHHVQMDGLAACDFLERFQRTIGALTPEG